MLNGYLKVQRKDFLQSAVLTHGHCEVCGAHGVARFYEDGTHNHVIKPCYHQYYSANNVSLQEVLEAIKTDFECEDIMNEEGGYS